MKAVRDITAQTTPRTRESSNAKRRIHLVLKACELRKIRHLTTTGTLTEEA